MSTAILPLEFATLRLPVATLISTAAVNRGRPPRFRAEDILGGWPSRNGVILAFAGRACSFNWSELRLAELVEIERYSLGSTAEVDSKGRPVFRCHDCGWTSYSPEDAKMGYCGRCKFFKEQTVKLTTP